MCKIIQNTKIHVPLAIFYKPLSLVIPLFLIEYWTEKKTSLVKWRRGWGWYHNLISVMFKTLVIRSIIGIARKISKD